MKLRTLVCLLVSVGSIAFSTSYATPTQHKDNGQSTITVADKDNIKWSFIDAQFTMSHAWRFMVDDMYDTILTAYFGEDDLSYLDQKYQLQKRTLDKIFKDSKLGVYLFSDTTIDISNDGSGFAYHFYFPRIGLNDLGITESDNITSAENASVALEHINTAIQTIDTFFPSSKSPSSLKAFMKNGAGLKGTIEGGVLNVNGADNANAILDSLVQDHAYFMYYLSYMQQMAQDVASSTGQHDDQEFQYLKEDIAFLINYIDIYGITIFNGGSMSVQVDGYTRTYDMPEISTSTFGMDGTDLTSMANAKTAYYALVGGLNWMGDWMVTGTTPTMKKITEFDLGKPVFAAMSKDKKMKMIKVFAQKHHNHK